MPKVVLILGGNQGDRLRLIQEAKNKVIQELGRLIQKSSLYETEAWGEVSSGDFLNQVLVLETFLSPEDVLDGVLAIENQLGRKREQKWGDRTMDIDILYYGQEILQTEKLIIPHPWIQARRFVLQPLAEVLPDYSHPVLHQNHIQLLKSCSDVSKVRIFEK